MKERLGELLLAVVVGVLLPALLLSVMSLIFNESNDKLQLALPENMDGIKQSIYDIVTIEIDGSIKQIPLEEYVISAVLREMPSNFHVEALKAQAIVARTYTVYLIKNGGKHSVADLCTDSTCCQGYWDVNSYLSSGGTDKELEKVKSAVYGTAGEILVYDGLPIEATYFSCSGGLTEDAQAVWGRDVPYLVSTSSPGEDNAKHYIDTVKMSTTEFFKKMGISLNKDQKLRIGKISYTNGGGVDKIEISGKVFKGTTVRKLLSLKSTAFVISVSGSTVIITTKGYGHRVGMSQYGADAMAEDGNLCNEILLHYYKDVVVVSLQDLY